MTGTASGAPPPIIEGLAEGASLCGKPTWCGLYSTSMSAWACWQQRRRELGWHVAWVKGLAGQLRGHQPGGRPEITNAQELGPSGGVLEHTAAALRGPDSGCCAAHSWGAADSNDCLNIMAAS